MTLDRGQREGCFHLTITDIDADDTVTGAHIHVGDAGDSGPPVVGLTPPTDGESSGCVQGVSAELIDAIRKNPAHYYVNVHTADFGPGAVRGQLSK